MIAIGGLALSRGLTLEGLTVSYLLRNTAASDTLMQMARWFGYRPGYEQICRLYLPQISLDHYEYVDEATEELRSEVKRMMDTNRTPADFGLKVRQSPLAIRVTAANKMRTASQLAIAQDYSARHVEGHALPNATGVGQSNRLAVETFVAGRGEPTVDDPGYLLWRRAGVGAVEALLEQFSFGSHADLAPISDRSLFQDYLSDRAGDELSEWDVAIPMRKTGPATPVVGRQVRVRDRDKGTVQNGVYRVYGSRSRVADPGDAWIDLDTDQVAAAEKAIADEDYRRERAACSVRERPLILVHIFNASLTSDPDSPSDDALALSLPVVTLSFCMPATGKSSKARVYQVNAVYRQQLELFAESDDDEELVNGDQDAG